MAPKVNRSFPTGSAVSVAGPTRHVPVLLRHAIDYVAPQDGGVYIDGTFGAGGYAAAILGTADARVIGTDRDASAIADGRAQVEASGGRLVLVEGRFAALDAIASGLGIAVADGVVLDLGVSSMQLDTPERGFSFRHDGPLDMRMGRDGPSPAPSWRRGDRAPSSPPARSPTSSAASSMVGPATFIRQRGRSRRCGCSSTTSFTNSKQVSRRPNAS